MLMFLIFFVTHYLGGHKKPHGEDNIFGHEAIVNRLHVVLHFVGTREFLAAHGAREHLPLVALVVEERVSLEAILIFERFLNVDFGTFCALIHALVDARVTEQIQAPDGHLRQVFGGVGAGGRGASAGAPARRLLARRRAARRRLFRYRAR